ncbi:mitochondrial assembly of ribosomal large subunit protein 1 [Conger conger]|uniref:mitochondrial assembly of ribosomal large subunit protein 1 n=1 Tax=Conger conger TaxID=82655 RepID=UPI002A5AE3CB|nr:mitochondrial assembly of ribosomal large subunit protein 1 [Conger conger]
MLYCVRMLRSSKGFLSKICIQDAMNVNRCFKMPRANLEFRACRYTWLALRRNELHASHVRFYTDMYRNKSDITEQSPSTLEEQKYADTETEKAPRHSTLQVFNIDVLVSLLRQENAADICVIKVPKELTYTDYFVVVSGFSSRHLQAMAFYAIKVYKHLRQDGNPHIRIEGKDAEDWMCIDFGDIVVHFMLPETREVYELEKLWTLRSFDEQLSAIPPEKLPEDFIFEAEIPK